MKKYCKHCVYYLKTVHNLSGPDSVDNNVCGESLRTYHDELGVEQYRTYGDTQTCPECGNVEQDGRHVRYQECLKRNKAFKCTAFKAKLYLRPIFYIQDKFKKDEKSKRST